MTQYTKKTDFTSEQPKHFPKVPPKPSFLVFLYVWTLTPIQTVLNELQV